MTALDWRLRDVLPQLRDSGRLNVLIALILRANVRNRCYPSMKRLAKDTGYGLEAVTEAKKWLEEHGAIEIVTFAQRVGDEKKIASHRQHIYQLTGVIIVDDVTYPYFYVSPTEILPSEISPTETEVVKEVKKIKKERKDSTASIEAREIPVTSSVEEKTDGENLKDQLPAEEAPKRKRSDLQLINDGLVDGLGEAFGVKAVGKDYSLYLKKAQELVAGTVPLAEFKWYCQYWQRDAAAKKYDLSIPSLTEKGRISLYVKARDAYRAKQEAGEVKGLWTGDNTTTIPAHREAVIIPETDVSDAVRAAFMEDSHV